MMGCAAFRGFARSIARSWTRPAYFLKVDVANFFNSIDRPLSIDLSFGTGRLNSSYLLSWHGFGPSLAARRWDPYPGRDARRYVMAVSNSAYLIRSSSLEGLLLSALKFTRESRRNRIGPGISEADAMQVSWCVELAVRPGRLEDFERLTGEMVVATRAENGVLSYERFISDDGQTIYVHERYESSKAAADHLRKFAAGFSARYASMVERKRFVVFGDPSDELKTLLDIYRATYYRPFGPFPYWG
jgi:quinol monooxygenase YgiN